ncbi:MAG: TIGR03067 domain-containing protein [Pirellulaceae bacterium]
MKSKLRFPLVAIQTRLAAGLLLAVFVATAAADEPATESAKAIADLQGTWSLDSLVKGGAEEDVALQLIINKQGVTAMLGETKIQLKMVLDPTCTPKVIDLTYISPEDGQPQAGTTLEGIYERSENKLRLCVATPEAVVRARPQEFASPPDSEILLLTFTRVGR